MPRPDLYPNGTADEGEVCRIVKTAGACSRGLPYAQAWGGTVLSAEEG
jgi:hypothetical protein